MIKILTVAALALALVGCSSPAPAAPTPTTPTDSTAFFDAWEQGVTGTGPSAPPVNPLDVIAGR